MLSYAKLLEWVEETTTTIDETMIKTVAASQHAKRIMSFMYRDGFQCVGAIFPAIKLAQID